MDWAEVQRAERWFLDRGMLFVGVGRMIPTVRSLVSVPAGLLHMRFRTFFIASTIGTAGWTAALALAGYWLRERFSEVDRWIGPVANGILVVMVGYYLGRVATYKPSPVASSHPD